MKTKNNLKWLVMGLVLLFVTGCGAKDNNTNDSSTTIYYAPVTYGNEMTTDLIAYNTKTKSSDTIIKKNKYSFFMLRNSEDTIFAIVNNNVAKISSEGKINFITNEDNDYVTKYQVYENKVYYGKDNTNMSDDIFERLAMKNTDGSGDKILHQSGISQLVVDKDGVFFAPNSGDVYGNIIRYDLNGKQLATFKIGNFTRIIKNGDYLYFIDGTDNGAINKIKIDGTNKTKITSGPALSTGILYSEISGENEMGIIDNYLYYINKTNNNIYRINTDGTNEINLINKAVKGLRINNNNIYYITQDNMLNVADLDGKNSKELFNLGFGTEYTIK